MSLRATLLTFVRALVRTSAVQTPLTARYIQYIILSGLVAVTPPSSLSLIISGRFKAAKAVQINTYKKLSKETAEKSLGGSAGKMCFLWSQYRVHASSQMLRRMLLLSLG